MQFRDRIRDFRRVPAQELRPNPRNWRLHPPAQQAALKALLAEVGYAGALLARELADGSLELIDGHLRAEATPNQLVPVLVLDVSALEADKLLATFDRLGSAAQTDHEQLRSLLASVQFTNPSVSALFDDLHQQAAALGDRAAAEPPPVVLREVHQVIVECRDESEQRELFHSLTTQGRRCRLATF